MGCLFIDFFRLMKYLGRLRSARINLNKPLTARSTLAIDSELRSLLIQSSAFHSNNGQTKMAGFGGFRRCRLQCLFFGSGVVHQSRACPDIV